MTIFNGFFTRRFPAFNANVNGTYPIQVTALGVLQSLNTVNLWVRSDTIQMSIFYVYSALRNSEGYSMDFLYSSSSFIDLSVRRHFFRRQ